MKVLAIASGIAILNLLCVPSVIASDAKLSKVRISVLGLNFGESPMQVKKKLAPRFLVDPKSDRAFSGQINGSEVNIYASYTPKTKRLVRVLINPKGSYEANYFYLVASAMETWSKLLTNKYGAPKQRVRTLNSGLDTGLWGIGGEQYKDLWRLANGTITCYVDGWVMYNRSGKLWVSILYEQDAMLALERVEESQAERVVDPDL